MRNLWELLNTRLHVDKCRRAIYAQLEQNSSFAPEGFLGVASGPRTAAPVMTAEDLQRHFLAQLQNLVKADRDALTEYAKLVQQDYFASIKDFEKLLEIGSLPNSDHSDSFPSTVDDDTFADDIENVAEDLEQNPLQAIALHELRQSHSVAGTAETPIPQEFFDNNAEAFTWEGNLVPHPVPCLWQDVHPDIPFGQLLSQEAREMVSVCRLYSQYRKRRQVLNDKTHAAKHVPCYEHVAGQMSTKSRFPQDDVGLFGIIVSKDDVKVRIFENTKESERLAIETCIDWLKKNNIWVNVHATNLQNLNSYLQETLLDFDEGTSIPVRPDRDGVRTVLQDKLGKQDAVLAITDLSEYNGQYAHLGVAFSTVREVVEHFESQYPQIEFSHEKHSSAQDFMNAVQRIVTVWPSRTSG